MVECPQEAITPQLFAVDKPYLVGPGSFTINGVGFGPSQGAGAVMLDSTSIGVTSWNDTTIVASVPGSVSTVRTSSQSEPTTAARLSAVSRST